MLRIPNNKRQLRRVKLSNDTQRDVSCKDKKEIFDAVTGHIVIKSVSRSYNKLVGFIWPASRVFETPSVRPAYLSKI
jgi:hypothetical protein